MCHFLTVAVPAEHVACIGEVCGRGFQAYPTANASVRAAIPGHCEAHLITGGTCSCDLYFGVTRDAHGLYQRFGIRPLSRPGGYMELHRPGVYSGAEAPDAEPGGPADPTP